MTAIIRCYALKDIVYIPYMVYALEVVASLGYLTACIKYFCQNNLGVKNQTFNCIGVIDVIGINLTATHIILLLKRWL